MVKFTVKKINPIKPQILQGKNLLVNFKIDFHKMKFYCDFTHLRYGGVKYILQDFLKDCYLQNRNEEQDFEALHNLGLNKHYNQSYNYIAILIYIKGFNFRNR